MVKNYVLYFYYHKKLYTGILEPYLPQWLRRGGYHPHMTVGKINSGDDYEVAILKVKDINHTFETIVDKVTIEIMDENQDSIIEMAIELK
ncbi:hypothetical protein [Tissierella pigra]|uniref:2'-5' RNA ligase family protein n=2 Tax=Tissierella pigra TaxID=2607614 RepID=A0A6N7XI01_9FIRM|nr:hypothetical protein [Tissierella pigra]MSU00362.1 2'-5' RNA ligase family protein [Tissierella pigra]